MPERSEQSQIRIAKYLAACGLASRRKCERFVAEGRVTVNGETVTTPALRVSPGVDTITCNGHPVREHAPVYILLYKPPGYTCSARDPYAAHLVTELFPPHLGRLFTVGRLDRESEGLLICTNDGDFAQAVAHPRHEVTKTYRVTVKGGVSGSALQTLRNGVEQRGEILQPREVDIIRQNRDTTELSVVLAEGKKREIRRMCAAVNLDVERLNRVAIGGVTAPELKPGEWRYLTPHEQEQLQS